MSYFDLVRKYKDTFYLRYMIIVNDKTAQIGYSILTNLHCDYGTSLDELYSSLHTSKKSKVNKMLSQYKKATGKKIRLTGTDNGLGYTRLVYELK